MSRSASLGGLLVGGVAQRSHQSAHACGSQRISADRGHGTAVAAAVAEKYAKGRMATLVARTRGTPTSVVGPQTPAVRSPARSQLSSASTLSKFSGFGIPLSSPATLAQMLRISFSDASAA